MHYFLLGTCRAPERCWRLCDCWSRGSGERMVRFSAPVDAPCRCTKEGVRLSSRCRRSSHGHWLWNRVVRDQSRSRRSLRRVSLSFWIGGRDIVMSLSCLSSPACNDCKAMEAQWSTVRRIALLNASTLPDRYIT